LNKFLNKILKTDAIDYVIASDTDSVYLRLGSVVEQTFAGEKTPEAIVEFLDKFSQRVLEPFIAKEFVKLANRTNAYENKMVMGREVIAQKGVWTAKKRYMLSVWDSEGVRYKEPKIKITGIETSRSSTPAIVRKSLKTAVHMILTQTEDDLQKYVVKFKKEFRNFAIEDISFPRSVSNLKSYSDVKSIYSKGTPIAVKAALIYNSYVRKLGLHKKYRIIGEGEKIKFAYLKEPNPFHTTVIGFPVTLPKEFDLGKYIDYDMQFTKSFMDPLTKITAAVGWIPEHRTTLTSLFS